ncbi:cysteine peptidase family C39 domain-containing protein [Couchioplanes caeruleus]|uniref:Peptidase C39-like domain-containing protein n=2 Tax=Couchioplanes caeruleus TaxID=56438 RepID=A0A1K0FKW6_9ACTN|nr:hypothetical protein [Couchioplanes caeruleus]OJF13485.1 hypothetical protein BG844_15025 [Couchioplanes caeruleus subsp. caeruleus]ROP28576.1 hypothetical protein EDD30_1340 [Couchioplanes caeruleus]
MTDHDDWTDTLRPFLPEDPTPEPPADDPAPEPQDGFTLPEPAGMLPFPEVEPAGGVAWVVGGQLVGDPAGDAAHWFEQAANGYCVPSSIAQIVSEYSGSHHADESAFVARANALHLFTIGPDGVPSMGIDGAHALLEDAGVPADIEIGIGVDTLVGYLAEGRRVMLAVDSDEIWYGREDEAAADHAVVLTGVDTTRGVAILSDPGTPDGNMLEVPLDVLADAWADGGNAALVCDYPPGEVPGPAFVDAEPGGPVVEVVPAVLPAGDAPAGVVTGAAVPGAADEPSGQVEAVVSWLVERPYVVLPVLLVGGAILARRR